jgi:hypothetical protein
MQYANRKSAGDVQSIRQKFLAVVRKRIKKEYSENEAKSVSKILYVTFGRTGHAFESPEQDD